MIKKLRYVLAYRFMDWGLRLIPDPFVRDRFEMANRTAAEVVLWETNQKGFDYGQTQN